MTEEIFFEHPEAKADFLQWFSGRNIHAYDIDKMPEFMAVPVLVKWLSCKGLYIEVETPAFCVNIWDYRMSEPDLPTVINSTPSEPTEDWLKDAIVHCIKNMDLRLKKTINV